MAPILSVFRGSNAGAQALHERAEHRDVGRCPVEAGDLVGAEPAVAPVLGQPHLAADHAGWRIRAGTLRRDAVVGPSPGTRLPGIRSFDGGHPRDHDDPEDPEDQDQSERLADPLLLGLELEGERVVLPDRVKQY